MVRPSFTCGEIKSVPCAAQTVAIPPVTAAGLLGSAPQPAAIAVVVPIIEVEDESRAPNVARAPSPGPVAFEAACAIDLRPRTALDDRVAAVAIADCYVAL